MSSPEPSPDSAEYVPFEDFRAGLPYGHFRVIVNPKLAGPFVAHRTHANALALALIGPGIAAALVGHLWLGAGLTAAGGSPGAAAQRARTVHRRLRDRQAVGRAGVPRGRRAPARARDRRLTP